MCNKSEMLQSYALPQKCQCNDRPGIEYVFHCRVTICTVKKQQRLAADRPRQHSLSNMLRSAPPKPAQTHTSRVHSLSSKATRNFLGMQRCHMKLNLLPLGHVRVAPTTFPATQLAKVLKLRLSRSGYRPFSSFLQGIVKPAQQHRHVQQDTVSKTISTVCYAAFHCKSEGY